MYKLDNIDDVDSTVDSTDVLTKEMLVNTLPDKKFRRYVTDELLELINSETDNDSLIFIPKPTKTTAIAPVAPLIIPAFPPMIAVIIPIITTTLRLVRVILM